MHNVVVEKKYVFSPPHPGEGWPKFLQRFARRRLRRNFGIDEVKTLGLEHLEASKKAGHGILLAPNHCRPADPFVVMETTRRVSLVPYTMASAHLFMQSPIQAWMLRHAGVFSVYREGVDRQAIAAASEILSTGSRPLVIFPEGVISRSNERLNALMDGTAFIARNAAKKRAQAAAGGKAQPDSGQTPSTGSAQPSTGAEQSPSTSSGQAPSTSSGQAPSTGSGQAPSTGSGQAPSTGSGQAPSTGSGQAPSTGSGQAPSTGSGQVVIHPLAIRYHFRGDINSALEPTLDEIEKRLSWRTQRGMPVIERIVKIGLGLLSLKEIEYMGVPQEGAIDQRVTRLVDHLLSPIEKEWTNGKAPPTVVGRVKALRAAVLPEMIEGKITDDERQRRWRQLEDMYLAQQLAGYPPDYIRFNPSPDRLLETVERFEEDLTDDCRIYSPMTATVKVGQAIPVNPARDRGAAEDPVMAALEISLREMIGELS